MSAPPSGPAAAAAIAPHLARALAHHALPSAAEARLAQHWGLVTAWNQRTNLTAILDPAEAAVAHYADSLALLPWLDARAATGAAITPLVDLGSGAGYPGLVIAIARPTLAVTLVEPRGKRASFLAVAAARLGLAQVRVRTCRVEDGPDRPYAVAATRATFSGLADRQRAAAWLAPGGALVAYRREADPAASEQVTYEMNARLRALEIWR